jgi:shikimate kinase
MKFFLVGLPGCGKSTLGKKFAYVMRLPFFDLDQLIEEGEGAPISELFVQHGEKQFREVEHHYLLKLESVEKAIIATGGGTPCFFNNMEMMNQLGMTIFLDLAPREIAHRLSENGISKRPLLKGKTREEIFLTLEHLRHLRFPYYSQSQVTLHNPDVRFNEDLLFGFQK